MIDRGFKFPKYGNNLSFVLKTEEKEFIKKIDKPLTHPLTII